MTANGQDRDGGGGAGRSADRGRPDDGIRADDLRDDNLRAMLAARADRAGPAMARAVLDDVRAEMRAPREGAGFAVLPVLTGGRGRGTRGSFGWAAAVAAVIIAAAVLGGRTQGGPAASVDPGARTAWPVATASGGPLVSPAVEPESEPLQPLLRDGSIDGQLLLIEGRLLAERLLAERWDCPGTAAADLPCVRYSFWGLDGVTVAWSGTTAVDLSTVPSQPGESPGTLDTWWEGTFVVVPEDGRLRLLGLLVGNLASPTTVPLALEAPRRFPNDSSPFDILPVAGWLANTKGTSCFGPIGHGACPAQISSSVPGADGVFSVDADVVAVDLALAPLGIDPTVIVTPGPFLVRFGSARNPRSCPRLALCTDTGWGSDPTVVGRYDPAVAQLRIVLP